MLNAGTITSRRFSRLVWPVSSVGAGAAVCKSEGASLAGAVAIAGAGCGILRERRQSAAGADDKQRERHSGEVSHCRAHYGSPPLF